jgi:hypothetical protein
LFTFFVYPDQIPEKASRSKSCQNKTKEAQNSRFKPQKLVGVRGFEPRASWSRIKLALFYIVEFLLKLLDFLAFIV